MKPKTCIRNTAPMSDTGMATTGTSTERNEPRKRKMTMTTMSSVSRKVRTTSSIALWMYSVPSYAMRGGDLLGQLLLDRRQLGPDALDDVERVGIGQRPDAR